MRDPSIGFRWTFIHILFFLRSIVSISIFEPTTVFLFFFSLLHWYFSSMSIYSSISLPLLYTSSHHSLSPSLLTSSFHYLLTTSFHYLGMYSLPSHLSQSSRDLILRLLVVDPIKRITIPGKAIYGVQKIRLIKAFCSWLRKTKHELYVRNSVNMRTPRDNVNSLFKPNIAILLPRLDVPPSLPLLFIEVRQHQWFLHKLPAYLALPPEMIEGQERYIDQEIVAKGAFLLVLISFVHSSLSSLYILCMCYVQYWCE